MAKSPEELRFVKSAEQMAPFLEHLQNNLISDFDNEDIEIQQYSVMNEIHIINEQDDGDSFFSNIALPPATTALATVAVIDLPDIYEEYVNFIDLSVLNPIIEARNCQKDELIESEISECK